LYPSHGNPYINIKQIATMSHFWPTVNTVTNYYKVKADSDKVKLDEQHRDYRWINTREDDLHPYIKEMIKNADLFR